MKFFRKNSNKRRILHKFPKKSRNPKHWLRSFLIEFYNLPFESNIDDWIKNLTKKLLKKSIDILITGMLIQICLFPFYWALHYFTGFLIPLEFSWIFIISYGLIWNAWENVHERLVEGKIRANHALPKR